MTSSDRVEFIARWIVRHPWWILLCCVLLVGIAASGLRWMGFTNDYRVYFSPDNPQLQAFEAMQAIYSKSDSVLIVVAPKSGEVFSRDSLMVIQAITERAWRLPYATRVDSVTNFQHTVAHGDELEVGDLVQDAAALSAEEIEQVRRVALQEPLLVRRLVSASGQVAGVNVAIRLPQKNSAEAMEVAEAARKIRAAVLQAHPDFAIYLTGIVMINSAFGEASRDDLEHLVPLMFGLVVLSLLLLLQSWSAVAGIVLLILMSIASAMGLAGWLGWKLAPTSAVAPTIILTMAVADCVHLMVTALHAMRSGQSKREALQYSLQVNFQPIFITSLTTAIGFLSMNFSDAPPFRDLGNMVAMGVVAAYLLSISFLPALMVVLPLRVGCGKSRLGHGMEHFADFVIRRRRALLWVNGALAVGLVSLAPLNELNDEFVKYFDRSVPFRQATDFTNQNLTGIYTLEYSLESGASGAISEPDYLVRIEHFSRWLRAQPEVVHVNTLTDTFMRLNQNMHGDAAGFYRLPESRELAAQYLLLYELSLPYGLDLNDQINIDKSALRMVITLETLTTRQVLALERRIAEWLALNAPELEARAASTTLMFSHIGERNIRHMLVGTLLALVLISLILIVAFRSVRLGLVSLVPNLIPAGMAFGIWALVDGRIGLSLSVVTGMTLGIVVDDTVHFLSKYRRARVREGMAPETAVRYAFSSVGVALWVTSVVLAAGFMVLVSSSFVQNSGMGLMTAITLVIALIMDFLFLPPLLMKMEE